MAMETPRECSACGAERNFWRVASTRLHLGRKIKWRCEECGTGIVEIGDAVDSAAGEA